MAQTCPQCSKATLIWGHRSTVMRHKWDEGEGGCVCEPRAVCVVCLLDVLRENGMLLLDGDAFPKADAALLN